MGRTLPRRVISPVMATSQRTGILRQGADDRGADGDAGGRAVLRNGAFRNVHVNIDIAVEIFRQAEVARSASGCSSSPACADSCITSPSLPVSVRRPLPSISVASVDEYCAADFRPGEAGGQADFVVLFEPGIRGTSGCRDNRSTFAGVISTVNVWPSVTTLRATLRQMLAEFRVRGCVRRLHACSGG